MNERIKELIKQCETLDGDEDGYFTRFDKEKFAELIVRECRITMSENFHECRTASLMDKKIKEHFGVQE